MRGLYRLSRVWTLAAVMLLFLTSVFSRSAEAEGPWTNPIIVFETDGYTSEPALVADSSGDVHLVFWSTEQKKLNAKNPGVLMYARLHQGVWSNSVDVVAPPNGGLTRQPSIALDDAGYLHVVFKGGISEEIYYTRAHVSEAMSSRGWAPPVLLSAGGASSGPFGVPAAITSFAETLHFVYADLDGAVYYRRSDNGGQTWSSAQTVSDTGGGSAADDPRILTDPAGRVFVTWSQFQLPAGWPPSGTFTTRSLDGGNTWSAPLRVAGENRALLNIASSDNGVLYRIWFSVGEIGEKMGQSSSDGGQTWTQPERVGSSLKGGLTGFPPMAFDSSGVLHFAPSATAKNKDGIFHLTWDGKSWSQPTFLSKGAVGKSSVEMPAIAVSRGNQLHVVYEDDFERIWYTSGFADSPQIAAQPVPPPVEKRATPVAAAPTATPVPVRSVSVASGDQPVEPSGPMWPLVASAGGVIILLGTTVIFRLRRLS